MIEKYAGTRNKNLFHYGINDVRDPFDHTIRNEKIWGVSEKMPKEPDVRLWLKPEDLQETTELEILTPHKKVAVDETGFKKPVFEINVKLPDGKKRTFTLSETKYRAISMLHGDDSDNWVNKKITVNKVPMNFKGEMVDAIIVKVKDG